MAPAAAKPARTAASPSPTISRGSNRPHVANSLDNLMTFPRLKKLVERGDIALHGAYFGVAHRKAVGARSGHRRIPALSR